MSRHIDADALKEKAKWYNIYSDKPPHSIRAVTTQEIDWMPTIEPERKKGKWINGKCDKCGAHAPYWAMSTAYYESNFCPMCGSYNGGDQE